MPFNGRPASPSTKRYDFAHATDLHEATALIEILASALDEIASGEVPDPRERARTALAEFNGR